MALLGGKTQKQLLEEAQARRDAEQAAGLEYAIPTQNQQVTDMRNTLRPTAPPTATSQPVVTQSAPPKNWRESLRLQHMNDPEIAKYVQQGRIGLPTDSDYAGASIEEIERHINSQLNTVRQEDKRIANLIEINTGKQATQADIDKYAQYAGDPSMLEAAIGKAVAKTPATGQYNTLITEAITSKLGRAPTEAELGYYGKQMEAGNIDPFILNQFLEQTSEYQTRTSDTARQKLAGELAGYDQPYLEKVGKQLEAKYSAQGRPGAGAYGSALIEAGKDLAKGRGEYLSGLGYQDFLRGQGNLRSDYENRLAQQYAQQQGNTGLAQESRQRYYANQDYEKQLAGQERLMRYQQSMQPKPQSFLQQLVPGLIGAGAQLGAAYLGKPSGGSMGWNAQNYDTYQQFKKY